MTHTRRIGALPALALTLVLAACSTPEDLNAPTLEPQFGTAEDEIGLDVASVSTGRIYSLSVENAKTYADNGDGEAYENGYHTKALLRRFDSSGTTTWTRVVTSEICNWDELEWDQDCENLAVWSLAADANGYTYVLTSTSHVSYNGYDPVFTGYAVHKLDASGNNVDTIGVNSVVVGPHDSYDDYEDTTEFTVDSSGNIYSIGGTCTYEHEEDGYATIGGDCRSVVTKYSTTGSVQWQRNLNIGTPSDITASSSGSVYVVGSAGFARYSSTGGLTWTKPGTFEEVIVSGSNLYTRYRKDVRKYDGNGNQLWLKTQSGLSTIVFQKMDGDGSGNVYLSGKYDADSSSILNMNAMVRKLNSSGTVLFTKTYGTAAYDDARGIATITGSEIYTTGETQGSLPPLTNIGGKDAYLRKQGSTGVAVWTR